MNSQPLAEWLTGLSMAERAKALNLLSYMLTVYAREYNLPSADSGPATVRKLIGMNELHHKISSQIGHYLDGDESKAYPVDVFGQILLETAGHYDIASILNVAIKSTKAKSSPPVNGDS